jgi:fibronectin-binding autotransporter adhesin
MRRYGSVCLSSLLVLLWASICAAQGTTVNAVRARISERMVVGSTTLGDVLRVVGASDVSGGAATMRPVVIDNNGDVRRDTNASVGTGGGWQLGSTLGVTGATTLSSTLGVTGAATLSSTLGVTGATTLSSTLSVGGNVSAPSGTLAFTSALQILTSAPYLRLVESGAGTDETTYELLADNDILSLDLVSDALSSRNSIFKTQRTGLVPGDFRWGALVSTVRPENNGTTDFGTEFVRYRTGWFNEMIATTFTSDETIIRSGGSEVIVEGSSLTRNLLIADTCLYVKHNSFRSGDVTHLHKAGPSGWQDEKIVISSSYVDCRVSGNCPTIAEDFAYCTLGRGHDGTSLNDWIIGDTIANEGQTGDGWAEITARRSGQGLGYIGQVVSDGPVAEWRMDETTSAHTADLMGNAPDAVETGTQSAGLGVTGTGAVGDGTVNDPAWQNTSAGGHLLIADDVDLRITGDKTIEMIVYWENGGGTDNLFSRGVNGEYHLQVASTGALTFCQGNGSSNECETTATGFIPNTTQTHIAIVVDATSSTKTVSFYKNGVFASSSTFTQAVTAQALTTAIGENPTGLGNPWDGNVDEVAVYNYQLSAARIAIHAAARTSQSVSRWTRGPSMFGWVRTGPAAFDVAMRWAIGNLAGSDYASSSSTARFGFGAGNSSAAWMDVTSTDGVRGMFGATKKFGITPAGVASFVEGAVTIDDAGLRIHNASSSTGDNLAYTFTDGLTYTKRSGLFHSVVSSIGETVLSAGDRASGNANLTIEAPVGDTSISAGDDLSLSALADGTFTASTTLSLTSGTTLTVGAGGNLNVSSGGGGNINFTASGGVTIDGNGTFTGTKTAGTCVMTITKGFIRTITGC